MKNKNHMSISIDSEKALDKQHNFILKSLFKIDIKETHYSTIKTMHEKLNANIILNLKSLGAFALTSVMRQGCPLSPFYFNIVLKVFFKYVRQVKEIIIKKIKLEKRNSNDLCLQMI